MGASMYDYIFKSMCASLCDYKYSDFFFRFHCMMGPSYMYATFVNPYAHTYLVFVQPKHNIIYYHRVVLSLYCCISSLCY